MGAKSKNEPVVAAGAVCWRRGASGVEVLLVHRDEHADVSLPKGKVDPGESPPETAVRETAEETGLRVGLGVPLGSTRYALKGRREKIVHYWAAEVTEEALADSTFRANSEIAALEWLTTGAAREALSYARDREILERFGRFLEPNALPTFAVIVARHGKAVPPGAWDGPDATRPLLHRGLEQAAAVAPAMAAFRPATLISSTAVRCQATIEPLARLTGLAVTATPDISQDAYEHGSSTAREAVRSCVDTGSTVVFCSHSPVIPDIVAAVAAETGTEPSDALRAAARLSTGQFSVLHLAREHSQAGVLAVETHSPVSAHPR